MKKIFFLAMLVITFASCKKEQINPANVTSQPMDLSAQTAALLKKADKNLYNQVYTQVAGQKRPYVSVKAIPGIFYIPGTGIDDATCWPSFNVCMVVVSAAKYIDEDDVTPDEEYTITGDYSETFGNDVVASLVINSDPAQKYTITSISAQLDGKNFYHINYN